MESIGKALDMFVFCVVGFLLPSLFFSFFTENLRDTVAEKRMQSFMQRVSTRGYLSNQMYQELQNQLNTIGLYSVSQLCVEHEQLAPEYVVKRSDLGTPFPVFTGQVQRFVEEKTQNQIIEILSEEEGVLHLTKGDRFRMQLEQGEQSRRNRLLELFFRRNVKNNIIGSFCVVIRTTG